MTDVAEIRHELCLVAIGDTLTAEERGQASLGQRQLCASLASDINFCEPWECPCLLAWQRTRRSVLVSRLLISTFPFESPVNQPCKAGRKTKLELTGGHPAV